MSLDPVVSVVIPAYNAAGHLRAALASCLRQTMADFEVLVVDDGSTDGTVAVAEEFTTDPRVRVLSLGVNRGVSEARNTALGVARGTWIATLDADDWMTDDRLEVLVRAAELRGADLAHDDELLVHEGETEPYSTLARATGAIVDDTVPVDLDRLIDCEIGGPSPYRLGLTQPILRRAFLEEHGIRYDSGLRVGEDHLLYLECLLAGARWIQIPTAHYVYVQRGCSATRTAQVPTIEAKLRVCEAVLARSTLSATQRASMQRYRGNLRSLLAYQRVAEPAKSGRPGEALRALVHNPTFFRRAARELPDLVGRRWAHYVRRDPHAFDMIRTSR